jgi:hypothetical protein
MRAATRERMISIMAEAGPAGGLSAPGSFPAMLPRRNRSEPSRRWETMSEFGHGLAKTAILCDAVRSK